ncbi:kelch-like protein 24 [Ornithodoros turicata]|uniref:kelch-like protein 24 n=1 Tax=Ornithodoros turicata TaxID=34597 RepID=UPI003138B056
MDATSGDGSQRIQEGMCSEEHLLQMSRFCQTLWEERPMTDVEVHVETRVFPAHKFILTCHSPYFLKLLLKTKPEMLKVQLNGITQGSFQVLLKYMYTGRLELTCQNIVDVFQAAKHLQMKNIKEKCAEVLTSSPDEPLHALFVYVSGKRLGTKAAWQKAFKTILHNFQQVMHFPEFIQLDLEHVCEILSADVIQAHSECELFWWALKWLNADWSRRECEAVQLLKCIRFSAMQMKEAVACFHPPLLPQVIEIPQVREMLNNAVCYISAKQVGQEKKFKQYTHSPRQFLETSPPYTREQGMGDSASSVVAASSVRGASPAGEVTEDVHRQQIPVSEVDTEEVVTTDPVLYQMIQDLTPSPIEWEHYRAKALPDNFRLRHGENGCFLIGGMDTDFPHQLSTGCVVLAYQESFDRWQRVAMMPEPRHHHAGAIIDDNVYIVGGYSTRRTLTGKWSPLSSCVSYNVVKQEWTSMADLRHGRVYHGVASVAGKLFVVGGKDRRGRILGALECWDPCTGRWQFLGDPPGLMPRMASAVAATESRLWLCGGITQLGSDLYVVSDVDCYDVLSNRCIPGPRLPFPCCFAAVAALDDDSLLHVGGLSLTRHRDQWAFRSRSEVLLSRPGLPWEPMTSLREPRHGASICCTWEGSVFLAGGMSTSRRRPPAELWTATRPEWSLRGTSALPGPLAGTLLLPLPH